MVSTTQYSRSTFKIYRNSVSTLDFLIKNIDRQPQTVSGATFIITTIDGQTQLYSAGVTQVDAASGHYQCVIPAIDSTTLPVGQYRWSVVLNINTAPTYLYTDGNYGAKGVIEIRDGMPAPDAQPTVFQPSDLGTDGFIYFTPAMVPDPYNVLGEHSLVAALTNYTGTIAVQGTLQNSTPNQQTTWSVVATQTLTAMTGNQQIPFSGNYNYLRVTTTTNSGVGSFSIL